MTKTVNNISGILLLDKPTNISSNKILQKIKKLFNASKAGHCGTLDPLATGLLPICFGQATKTATYLTNSSKTYRVTGQFGIKTDTGDIDGRIIETKDFSLPKSSKQINTVLQSFIGELNQIPPMYSAIKHNGRPLYKYAYKGETIQRTPRKVFIKEISLNSYSADLININVHCSKGTYIRTLIEDIAEKMNAFATVKNLRRLSIEGFKDINMKTWDQLKECESQNELLNYLKPLDYGLSHLPTIRLSQIESEHFSFGQKLLYKVNNEHQHLIHRIYDENNYFIGLAEVNNGNEIKPKNVFKIN
ncbi:uncharacterized protein METZ01_LOCUS43834 [marine metagenome]|uniref:tRNA pseudouridine(55) synthase n=1 Tax=marine metagenome TaxID=408172 RepID=A0A381RGU6_9ZZZZ